MSLYDALLSKRHDLYARVSPDALVDEYLLPMAGRIDKLEARIAQLEQSSPSLTIFLGRDSLDEFAPEIAGGSPSDDLKHVQDARHNIAQERPVSRHLSTVYGGTSNLDLVTGGVW